MRDRATHRSLPARARQPGLVDVTHYDLELDYQVSGNRLDRPAPCSRVVAAATLSRISLDLAHLRVSKVRVDGAPGARFGHRGGKLHIDPGRPAAAG